MRTMWPTIALVALLPLVVVEACLSSGVCGGGSSCYTPPAPTCQQQSCQPGYSCGSYGCARNRARSSLTHNDGTIVPVDIFLNKTAPKRNIFGFMRKKEAETDEKIDTATYLKLTNPNFLFRQCCEDRQLPDSCLPYCHFNVFSKDVLQEMFLKNSKCPVEAAADIQYCAAQGRDHRPCCFKNRVHQTLAGEKCLIFCDQRAGSVHKLDFSFLPCYERFETIKRCFYDEIKMRMELKLGPQLEKGA